MKFIIIAFFSLGSYYGLACTCPSDGIKKVRDNSIKNSDLIFIGEVIGIDTVQHIYKIKVLEVFKGKPGETVIGSPMQEPARYSSCSFWPNRFWGSEFIFYANRTTGTDQIFIDQCSATRSISNPQIHLSYFTGKYEKMQGAMSKEMTFGQKMEFIETDNRLKQIAFRDLKEELKILHKLKRHITDK